MPDNAEPSGSYKVSRLEIVNEQIRQLGQRATLLGMSQEIKDALLEVVAKLETEPLTWGDPQYATRHPGGLVLRGLRFPLLVRYAAFENERAVIILHLRVFPGHPLADEP
jgi:hypothetical protein